MIDIIETLSQLQGLVAAGYGDPDYYKDKRVWEKYGMVKASYANDLVLFNYTAECNSKPPDTWNYFETISRGLILHRHTGNIIAHPFHKFWNYVEGTIIDSPIKELTEKMDGSLGIIYYHNGGWHVATRGSFDSEQAVWAEKYLHKNYDVSLLNLAYTYLVEIIYPENRIVVDYGSRTDLVLIGMRANLSSGVDLPYSEYSIYGNTAKFNLPRTVVVNSLEDIKHVIENLDQNAEGFVARLDNGTRLKFKTEDYMRIHKFISYFSFKHVLEAVQNNNIKEIISLCPTMYLQMLYAYVTEINNSYAKLSSELEIMYKRCDSYALFFTPSDLTDEEYNRMYKKTYAEVVLNEFKNYSKLLFMKRDGKDLSEEIYKEIERNHKEDKVFTFDDE